MAVPVEQMVEGYLFGTMADADLARVELYRIEQLEAKMDYQKPMTVRMIYQKAIENRTFKTPIGLTYLKKLRDYLMEQMPEEEIPPVPLYTVFVSSASSTDTPAPRRIPSVPKPPKKKQITVKSLIVTNVLLGLLVVAMFIVVLIGTTPNMLNYERALQDKYAAWEQELADWEQELQSLQD